MRTLNVDEIEARVGSVNENGCTLLLYKTARIDSAILDEEFGRLNWQCEFKEIKGNMYCGIGVYDAEKSQWVWKWDCGVESNTEKEKGEASDAFKRAGFKWQIGSELYSSPFIWINLSASELIDRNGKKTLNPRVKFTVSEIGYNDKREINKLSIVDNNGELRYEIGKKVKQPDPNAEKMENYKTNLVRALQYVKEATTTQELEKVWNDWTFYRNDKVFKAEVIKRKNELNNAA